jgi:hypothetical protein
MIENILLSNADFGEIERTALQWSILPFCIYLPPYLILYWILRIAMKYKISGPVAVGPISYIPTIMMMWILAIFWYNVMVIVLINAPKVPSENYIISYLAVYFSGGYLYYLGLHKFAWFPMLVDPFNWLVSPCLAILFGIKWRKRQDRAKLLAPDTSADQANLPED